MRARTVTDQPSLLARIDRAIYRLQNTHGLPPQALGDGSDPEAVLRACADDHARMRRVLCELQEAILEQVGTDQTDRLRHELADRSDPVSVGVERPPDRSRRAAQPAYDRPEAAVQGRCKCASIY